MSAEHDGSAAVERVAAAAVGIRSGDAARAAYDNVIGAAGAAATGIDPGKGT